MEGIYTAFFGAGERGGPRVYDGHDHLVELGAAKHQTVTSCPSSRFFWGRASQEEEGMEKNIRTLSRRQRAPQQSSFFSSLEEQSLFYIFFFFCLYSFPFSLNAPFFPSTQSGGISEAARRMTDEPSPAHTTTTTTTTILSLFFQLTFLFFFYRRF